MSRKQKQGKLMILRYSYKSHHLMKVGATGEESQLRQSEGQWKTVKQELTRRELDFIKNDKTRVRAICKGTIPDLGLLDPCGPSQNNKESEENKCPWVLYACKWEQEVDREIRTYEKVHRLLHTRNCCRLKAILRIVPTRALHEQLQREYQVDISKMKVFRAKIEALNQVRGDYAGQYTTLRDYVQELRTRNPGTTVKIEVESKPNPASETRTLQTDLHLSKDIEERDYLGLDGTFMKGPYPGMILTTVGLDGNNYTYPLAYVVVEAENINS
uniref:MULE transposase domain-containing protein n=1 Tax=Lactuca sativa TaxID=4236 RepID=A0A9R1VHH0_LACSA|nr:hypothetical protein LSAT_V11C500250010 [Lactuca sativa]